MSSDDIILTFSAEGDSPLVEIEESRITTLAELLRVAPDLGEPEKLERYCAVINHLKYGSEYQLITDPDAYRARYEEQYQAEDPNAPFQEGVARLRDFGHCETGEIATPRLDGKSVVFYVEDDYLGIPYKVTGPAPSQAEGDVIYEPLPMLPAGG